MKDKLSPVSMNVVGLLVFLTFLLITYVFYSSEGRERVEDYFFDLRTRLGLFERPISNVLVVSVNDNAIKRIEGNKRRNLSIKSLSAATDILCTFNPKAILIIDWQHIFSRDPSSQQSLVELLKNNRQTYLGTFGYDSQSPWSTLLPSSFIPISSRVFGVDSFKPRSNSIVRSLPYRAYRGFERRYLAPAGISALINPDFGVEADRYYLNYVPESSFPEIGIDQVFSDDHSLAEVVAGKVLVIGYTSFRTVPYQTPEQIRWNTPLEGDPNNYLHGASSTYVTALALENILNDTFLRPVSLWFTVIQTIIMAVVCFASWHWGVLFAVSLICGSWIFLVVFHVWLFELQSTFIPISDTFLFSSGALLLGALLRLGTDIRQLAFVRVRLESKRALAIVQGRFLDRFSVELSRMNKRILDGFISLVPAQASASYQDIIARAQKSCTELGDYLDDISLLSQMEAQGLQNPELENFDLSEVIEVVIRSLDAKAEEKSIRIQFTGQQQIIAYSNPKIVDTILFNFVSNAIKYSPENSSVSIQCSKENGLIVISVIDQGPGISEEFRDKIFEKFYRIKNDDVYRVKGTGLGLYLCKFFADKINARIYLKSELAKGSTFSLEIRGGR